MRAQLTKHARILPGHLLLLIMSLVLANWTPRVSAFSTLPIRLSGGLTRLYAFNRHLNHAAS
jgi:hypothetical protein